MRRIYIFTGHRGEGLTFSGSVAAYHYTSAIRGNKGVKPEGKWGLGYPGSTGEPLRQGFSVFYGYNCQTLAHNYYPDQQHVPIKTGPCCRVNNNKYF